ncbi:hypothetical protein [Burkholderia contaminans]|uniref:hypothetical protein n=1 Tax=Burkholderia contaminans TaxID=488447 RepID=UPI0021AB342E|nr:hypothetical protein [Burkholderia contaminans]
MAAVITSEIAYSTVRSSSSILSCVVDASGLYGGGQCLAQQVAQMIGHAGRHRDHRRVGLRAQRRGHRAQRLRRQFLGLDFDVHEQMAVGRIELELRLAGKHVQAVAPALLAAQARMAFQFQRHGHGDPLRRHRALLQDDLVEILDQQLDAAQRHDRRRTMKPPARDLRVVHVPAVERARLFLHVGERAERDRSREQRVAGEIARVGRRRHRGREGAAGSIHCSRSPRRSKSAGRVSPRQNPDLPKSDSGKPFGTLSLAPIRRWRDGDGTSPWRILEKLGRQSVVRGRAPGIAGE